MNLHGMVRGAIAAVNPDETLIWYPSTGESVEHGIITPIYGEPVALLGQIQTESDATLFHANAVDESSISRAFYVYADKEKPVFSLIRPLARGGDLFFRPAQGTWWLVCAVPEDFSQVGWCKVRAVLQINPPEGLKYDSIQQA